MAKKGKGGGNSFLVGRDARTGRLIPVDRAKQQRSTAVVERMPKRGRGDSGRGKGK